MNKAIDFRQEPQVVFEYTRGPNFHSVHADGVIGGLTPSGHIHVAFFSERPMLPRKHVFKLNPDGSLGAEVPDDRASQEPVIRDMQIDVLMTANTAEMLRNWLDQYIKTLRNRTSTPAIPSKPASLSTVAE